MGLLVEAAVRVPLVYLLAIDVMVGLSTAIQVAAFVGFGAWTLRAKARGVARRGVAARASGPEPAGPHRGRARP